MTTTSGLADGLQVVCPRCGTEADPGDVMLYRGCEACAQETAAVNLVARLPADRVGAELKKAWHSGCSRGMWRWAGALPVDAAHGVHLGEGDTPLLDAPALASRAGVRRVSVKNESTNPTWSHKDRLAAMTVAAAKALGASTIVAASTGNHGASLAAYSARAGLDCVIYTLQSVPTTMKTLMQAYGARVVAVSTSAERYELLDRDVSEHGWFPGSNATTPPVGSHPLGVAGYRSLAYEIAEQCEADPPDVVIVPVAYGDCLAGIAQGLDDLVRADLLPRAPVLVGAEVLGALNAYLRQGTIGPVQSWDTAAFSIASPYATWQSGAAVRSYAGTAIPVPEDDLGPAQLELARGTGLFVEAASAAAVAALDQLHDVPATSDDHVVVVATSSGLKDPASVHSLLPEVTNRHA